MRFLSAGCLAIAVATGSACRDSSPTEPAQVPKVTTIRAASDTALAGVAGAIGPDLTVVVRDAAGHAVTGAVVHFTVAMPFNGQTDQDVTSVDGNAVLKGWNLGPRVGTNVVTATSGVASPVTFHVVARAAAPHFLTVVAGDHQEVATGDQVPIRPSVRLTDVYHNPIVGGNVTFSVASDDMSDVAGAVAATDSAGIATVGAWMLTTAGNHSLSARYTGGLEAEFSAIATSVRLVCGQQNILREEKPLQSELSTLSCRNSDGRLFDMISVLPTSDAFTVSMASSDFDTSLEVRDESGNLLAKNDSITNGGSGSHLTAIFGIKRVVVSAMGRRADTMGRYLLSYGTAGTGSGCEEAFVIPGISVRRDLYPKPCDVPGDPYGDRYRIFLKKDARMIVDVADLGYSDWHVVVSDPDGVKLAEGTLGLTYHAIATIVAPRDGFYTIKVTSPDGSSLYTLSIR